MRKLTNTLSPSPKGFQSPKFSDSDSDVRKALAPGYHRCTRGTLEGISDGDFGKYFHLPVSVNFGKWILFTGKLPVNQLTP
jgi:hypothetical protein